MNPMMSGTFPSFSNGTFPLIIFETAAGFFSSLVSQDDPSKNIFPNSKYVICIPLLDKWDA